MEKQPYQELAAGILQDINKGTITVGGVDISESIQILISLYSIVFQDVTLFNNTIMENIRMEEKDATDEKLWQQQISKL